MEPLIDPVHGHGRYGNASLYCSRSHRKLHIFLYGRWGGKVSAVLFLVLIPSLFFIFCSQSLVNLFVTGHAVSNVWDGDRECSGMSKASYTYSHTKHTKFTLTEPSPAALDLNLIHQKVINLTSHSTLHKMHIINTSLTFLTNSDLFI